MKAKGRKVSARIEDRRADPKGATRFSTDDNASGDITFRPPLVGEGTDRAKVLPYRDPEAAFNALTEDQQKAYLAKVHDAIDRGPRAARTIAAAKRKTRWPIAMGTP